MAGPVFIIGCPRSGTTLLLDLLAGTRSFGYVSTTGRHCDVTEAVHGRTRVYDTPVGDLLYAHREKLIGGASRLGPVGPLVRRCLPKAIEPWKFWEDLVPNFRPEFGDGPAVDPNGLDLSLKVIERTQDVVATLLERQQRDIFLSKYTDFPRVDLLRTIFPDARFVHISRDPYAVANSYAVEIERSRFGTWAYRDWWAAQWPEQAREQWRSSGETMLGFAAHNRNRLVSLIEESTAGDRGVLHVTYEELTLEPIWVLRRILSFVGMGNRADLGRLVDSRRIANTNQRWQSHRSAAEVAVLDAAFANHALVEKPIYRPGNG